MIPLQFPQWPRLPFFGTLIKRPSFHSSEHIQLPSLKSHSTKGHTICSGTQSFSFLIALLISFLDILPQLILSSSSLSASFGTPKLLSLESVFSAPLKNAHSTCLYGHLLVKAVSHHKVSLTGIKLHLVFFPAIILVRLYNSVVLFAVAASSACCASSSIHFFLSFFTLCFTYVLLAP